MYIPDNNKNNPTKCAGNWGTDSEFQCMFLACDSVFDKGVCENPDVVNSPLTVPNIYKRPKRCPFNKGASSE